jgi:hypothetical protein
VILNEGSWGNSFKITLDQGLVLDLFSSDEAPEILSDGASLKRIKSLRDDLSHGNIPITLEVIDEASRYAMPLEQAAFHVLQEIRLRRLDCADPLE